MIHKTDMNLKSLSDVHLLPSVSYAVLRNVHNDNKMLCQLSPHFSDLYQSTINDTHNNNNIPTIPITCPEKIPMDEFNATFAILANILTTNPDIFYHADLKNVTDAQLHKISVTIIATYTITQVISIIKLLDYLHITCLLTSLASTFTQYIGDNIENCRDNILTNFNLEKDEDGDDVLQYEIPYHIILAHIQPNLMVHELALVIRKKCFIVRDSDSVTHLYDPSKDIPGYNRTYLVISTDPSEYLSDDDNEHVTHVHYKIIGKNTKYPQNVIQVLYGSNEHYFNSRLRVIRMRIQKTLKGIAVHCNNDYRGSISYHRFTNSDTKDYDYVMHDYDVVELLCDRYTHHTLFSKIDLYELSFRDEKWESKTTRYENTICKIYAYWNIAPPPQPALKKILLTQPLERWHVPRYY